MLDLARDTLLKPTALTDADLDHALAAAMGPGIDAADLYFQFARTESWVLDDGIVKEGSHAIEQGVGVRTVSDDRQALAYSDDLSRPALLDAARAARSLSASGVDGGRLPLKMVSAPAQYAAIDPIDTLDAPAKVALLKEIDTFARGLDPRVKQVIVSIAASHEVILIAASDGTLAADVRPLVRFNVQVIAEANGRREQGSSGGGGRYALNRFLSDRSAEKFAREAVRQALVNLESVAAPAGSMTVVLGPGWPGVLLHEAVGHGLEGDFNRKGTSAFSGRVGEQVASKLCTVVDDGLLANRRGSLSIDDEGTPTECTTLIENGVLKGYLQDKLNGRLSGVRSTGSGRRESFAQLPMPRMRNTYLRAGDSDPQEIIASVPRGLYAVNFGGGQVDITSGKFVFSASEAYLIENGRVTRPVKGATLIGSGPEVMTRISRVGNDLRLDEGVGVCGKEGQSVPVGVGQPTLKIDGMTVGGTG
jgi:TldD protein